MQATCVDNNHIGQKENLALKLPKNFDKVSGGKKLADSCISNI